MASSVFDPLLLGSLSLKVIAAAQQPPHRSARARQKNETVSHGAASH